MKHYKQLSPHDRHIEDQIQEIDKKFGWLRWTEISSLADKFEDEEYKRFWHTECVRYNHIEEYHTGTM